MSIVSPRCFIAIAEHSICHPGLPLPQGLSQEGSPGFAAFHISKSRGIFFAFINLNPRASEQVLWLAIRKLAILSELIHAVIDASINDISCLPCQSVFELTLSSLKCVQLLSDGHPRVGYRDVGNLQRRLRHFRVQAALR